MSAQSFHIAIIPDGNRRWARSHGRPASAGHIAGAKAAGPVFEAALELGATHLTFWGCSVANLTGRSKSEVRVLYTIFERYFTDLLTRPEIEEHHVRVRALGLWRDYFPKKTSVAVDRAMQVTEKNDGRHLTFLLAYSGTDEMLQAVEKLRDGAGEVAGGELKGALWTHDLPPVDLVIRTGGEPHWSQGFMMWDVAEAQLAFTETLWPAFTPEELKAIVERYRKTERRRGA